MKETVIKVENLSKAYQIGQIGTGTISRDIERFVRTKVLGKEDTFYKIGEANDRSVKGSSDIVWSLRDINFEIQQGDAVGIIGKNGAGKSTLLKVLSRVTGPTEGNIKVKGRIASLLEVGTGFHPELTGRENIFLNGAILGMRKKEIRAKLDEIIDFSGVERYIDTPVKRYSSGMYVRLAFAVAAHLDSEILIVDEVLAVGDAEFQKKCLGKMGEISKGEGRTVLFVSHNMSAVSRLCTKGILISNGKILQTGNVEEVVETYLKVAVGNKSADSWDDLSKAPGSEFFKLRDVRMIGPAGQVTGFFDVTEPVRAEFTYEVLKDGERYTHGLNVFNDQGVHILSSHHSNSESLEIPSKKGVYRTSVEIPANLLAEGGYELSFAIMKYKPFEVIFHKMDILGFSVVDELQSEDGRGSYSGKLPGLVRSHLKWTNI
ncbi:ABC transporter ATP-binding protein [Flavobacterium silvaticum]|uniref:ABC transporter ATP-binding protein n=1 Tax=Flavobacterium silvaticum TaxID=1852020 RepID=A0A972JIW6_9FLAO|nr:ABC transporter ATP-binding protein [Flavobacterium silvaticum]NMH29490.1 ABC transporter ATP-binding protein [Flavobacterium silvaticum]